MNNILPILFVRYAPGASGNYLISLLQSSNMIDCWNQTVEQSKGTKNFKETYQNWFSDSFQPDLENHFKFEPHHPYKLDFISARYPRGDSLSKDGFVEELQKRNDELFLKNIQNNKTTILRLNKIQIPKFSYGATVINIVIDPLSQRMFHRMRSKKLFGIENGFWISKENHPEFVEPKYGKMRFNNPYQFDISKYKFLKNFIIDRPYTSKFGTKESITSAEGNDQVTQYFVTLSDLLSVNIFHVLEELFHLLGLGIMDKDLVQYCYERYYQTSISPFIK
jgi:hypothetical protein